MAYMAKSLKGVPEAPLKTPEGVLVARINAETGLRENEGGGVAEYFYAEFPPRAREDALAPANTQAPREVRNQLF
jgi:penicillin-binding protein 1A